MARSDLTAALLNRLRSFEMKNEITWQKIVLRAGFELTSDLRMTLFTLQSSALPTELSKEPHNLWE